MMPPTIKSLEYLVAHDDAASVMESSAAARPAGADHAQAAPRRATGGSTGVSLPDDDDYADFD